MIETVLCCGTHNFVSAQVPVPTSFDLDTWNTYLHNYDDKIFVQYLHYGWPINYQSDVLPSSTLQNHSSAVKNNWSLLDYLEEEVIHRAIIGAFTCNPFSCPRCEQSTLFPYSFSFWPSFSYHGMSKSHKGSNSYIIFGRVSC